MAIPINAFKASVPIIDKIYYSNNLISIQTFYDQFVNQINTEITDIPQYHNMTWLFLKNNSRPPPNFFYRRFYKNDQSLTIDKKSVPTFIFYCVLLFKKIKPIITKDHFDQQTVLRIIIWIVISQYNYFSTILDDPDYFETLYHTLLLSDDNDDDNDNDKYY